MLTFTEAEVRRIIGQKVDLKAKFEDIEYENGEFGMHFVIEDTDSDDLVGEKLAYYANAVAAVTRNEVIDEQLSRMMKISGVVK